MIFHHSVSSKQILCHPIRGTSRFGAFDIRECQGKILRSGRQHLPHRPGFIPVFQIKRLVLERRAGSIHGRHFVAIFIGKGGVELRDERRIGVCSGHLLFCFEVHFQYKIAHKIIVFGDPTKGIPTACTMRVLSKVSAHSADDELVQENKSIYLKV